MIELHFRADTNGWRISVALEECGLPDGVFGSTSCEGMRKQGIAYLQLPRVQ
jgi:hypothetical protein